MMHVKKSLASRWHWWFLEAKIQLDIILAFASWFLFLKHIKFPQLSGA